MTVDLRKGDCMEVMKNIPDRSVDMILCDLPLETILLLKYWSSTP